MFLSELLEVVYERQNVILRDEDCHNLTMTRYPEELSEYSDAEITSVTAENGVLVVDVEMPTFTVTGRIQVEFEVKIRAINADAVDDVLMNIDVYTTSDGAELSVCGDEVVDYEINDATIEWDDVE